MQIDVPPELEPFVEQEFATGRYATRAEVVVQALRFLQEERQEAVLGIQQGLDDIAAGRTQPLAEAFADIRNVLHIRRGTMDKAAETDLFG